MERMDRMAGKREAGKRGVWRVWVTLLTVMLTLGGLEPEARADSELDLGKELLLPGTRVLVVEFYSLTCKPCMAAVPKWAALHAKYRSAGLRFVVVAASEDGDCTALPWSPDKRVCDVDDFHKTRLRVTKLPTAMAWSWDGKLLAKGHVKEVEAAVEQELKRMPRALVKVAGGDSRLADAERLIRAELGRTGKIEVAATEAELKEIEAIQRAAARSGVDEESACEAGKQLAANSLLAVSLGTGANAKLTLQLRSAESGCLLGLGQAAWDTKNVERTVQAAVAELVSNVAKPPQIPGGASENAAPGPVRRQDKIVNPEDAKWKPTSDDPVLVTFDSQPSKAMVEVDGKVVCKETSCTKAVNPGVHVVRMSAEKVTTREERVRVDGAEQRVNWQLESDVGIITIDTGTADVPIRVDGQSAGRSPLRIELSSGPHRVELKDPCYADARADLQVEGGTTRRVELKAVQKTAGLRIELSDANDHAVAADVKVDGVVVGRTWKTLTVPACAKQAEVATDQGAWSRPLALKERETSKIEGALERQDPVKSVAVPVQIVRQVDSGPPVGVPSEQMTAAQRDERTSRLKARSRSVLTTEIAGVESLLSRTPYNDPDRPQILRRLAESYVELQAAAFREKTQSEVERDDAIKAGDSSTSERKQREVEGGKRVMEIARKKAIEYYTSLKTGYPEYPQLDEVLYYLAYEYEHGNENDEARKIYLELVKSRPNSRYVPNGYLAFGELFFNEAQGDPSKWALAEQAYKKVIEYKPEQGNKVYGYAWYKLAYVHWNNRRYAEALNAFKKTIDYGVTFAQMPNATKLAESARKTIVPLYAVCGKPEAAPAFFKGVAGDEGGSNTRTVKMLGDLGQSYLDTGHYKEAQALYKELSKLDGSSDGACSYRVAAAEAVIAANVANKPVILTELDALLQTYKEFVGRSVDANAKQECANRTAQLTVQSVLAWHFEAIGGANARGAVDAKELALVLQLYKKIVEAFTVDQFSRIEFPELPREEWPTWDTLKGRVADLERKLGKRR